MIHRIFSDLPSFKPIRFQSGLNVLVAEKTRTATDRQTRNGAGKSSLIELIHFALGADCARGCIFRNQALGGFRFGIEMDIGESRVKVSRSGSKPSSVLVSGLDAGSRHGGETTQHSLLEEAGFEVKDWRDILGEQFFGLPPADSRSRFAPTFRSLFPYFARRQASGGFDHPERHDRDQQLSDQ
jgi:uncharacterized protein YydD (DUF2326 family)